MTTETAYTTVDAVRAFNQDDEMSEALLALLIPAVSRAIDKYCRRMFYTVTATRLYDWTDAPAIRLRDDLVSLTGITCNDDTVIDIANLTLEPRIGPPYSRIAWNQGIGAAYAWSVTKTNALAIAGVWGYKADLPEDIGLACIAWVSDLYAGSDSRGLDSVSGAGVRASLTKVSEGPPPDVKGWLDHYRKPTKFATMAS